ncbi:MAG: hypothetical protein BWX98_01622 [Candidatus Aminicenantes bacterium ADurb.Bin147]|nr:MAG: hypothetical protein BWX98_01622 [Candidatus Aminicenantes bacterium ADurb.Bin147]
MQKSVRVAGFNETIGCLREVRELLNSPEPMEGILSDVHARILERTAAGKDYKSHNFNPYSESYAKKKGTMKPDLRVSGTMLDAIKTNVVSPNHGRVYVEPNAEPGGKISAEVLAAYQNEGTSKTEKHAGIPKREFMGITDAQLQLAVKRHYDDRILEIVRGSPLRGDPRID